MQGSSALLARLLRLPVLRLVAEPAFPLAAVATDIADLRLTLIIRVQRMRELVWHHSEMPDRLIGRELAFADFTPH